METAMRLFVPVAIRDVAHWLVPRLEDASSCPVTLTVDLNPAIARRIGAGELFDLALTNPPHVAALIAAGHVDGASHRPFGLVPLAVARKAGTGGPVLTGTGDIIALLRDTASIGYTAAGTSGRVDLDTMARLGLSEVVRPRSHPMDAGAPVASVADGSTEFAVVPLTTVQSEPGVEPAAIFAETLGAHIDMSVFLSRSSRAGLAWHWTCASRRTWMVCWRRLVRFGSGSTDPPGNGVPGTGQGPAFGCGGQRVLRDARALS